MNDIFIQSNITFPKISLLYDNLLNFLCEHITFSLEIPEAQMEAEKKYFSEQFAGVTVCGNLWQIGTGKSIKRVYEKMDKVENIIYDVPLVFLFLNAFFYSEW